MERCGPESLTLGAVEEEAGLAPATIDAYFADTSELFLAIVADDLAQFARRMGEQEQNEVAPIAEMPPTSHESVTEAAAAVAPADYQDLAKLQDAVARLEARPVDAWLERRLREFERGLAAIESKLAGMENTGAQLVIEESVRSLSTRFETLEAKLAQTTDETLRRIGERLDASQDQSRQAHSDIDAVHARIARRLDALENAAFAAAPAFFQPPALDETPRIGAVAETIASPVHQPVMPDSGAQLVSATGFLSAARRSAQEAHMRAETERPPPRSVRRLAHRTLYWIAGGLTVLVGLIWTGVYVTAREVAALPTIEATSPVRAATVSSKRLDLPKPASPAAGLAQAGSAIADLMIGLNFLTGPQHNDAAAAKWLGLAAQQGNAPAALKLATLYRDGRGVPADAALAFHWYKVAAHAQNCKAMYDLAVAYAEGWGTAKDYAAAVRWFAQAASLGLTDSQFNLGVMYERGLGVPTNPADAYKWYLIAAAQGDRQAELRIAALKPELDSSELAAAEEAAAAFKAAPRDRDANEIPTAPRSSAS